MEFYQNGTNTKERVKKDDFGFFYDDKTIYENSSKSFIYTEKSGIFNFVFDY